jgi:murein DD-endopeptidase MepM/ murein hydrolase activator NlpD
MTTYRKKLVEDLQIEMNTLLLMNNQLEKNKNKNELLLKEKKIELQELEKDKNKSAGIVNELKRQEVSLKKEIEKQESIQREIENQIKKIIEEEAAKAAKAGKALTLTPEEKLISVEFIKNMGKLPWPSDNGIVTGKYGEQNHPVLKGIKINNNGIDVSTAENTKIRSVFNGEVTKVVAILGANYTVIIKHGEYRTVYQNLVNVKVKSGDKVYAKSEIGTVYTDPENTAKYHFEVWKGKEKTEDPEIWLSK